MGAADAAAILAPSATPAMNRWSTSPMCGSGTFRPASSPCAARPTCTGTSASSTGPRSGGRRASTGSAPRRGPTSERAVPHPRVRIPSEVEAARANVKAGRLEREITIAEADATRALPLEGLDHLLVSNPPLRRLACCGGQKGMKTFDSTSGERLGALSGFHGYGFSGNPAFEAAFHHRPLRRRPLWNGPIECTPCSSTRRAPQTARLTPAEQPADVPPARSRAARSTEAQHGRSGRSPGQTTTRPWSPRPPREVNPPS